MNLFPFLTPERSLGAAKLVPLARSGRTRGAGTLERVRSIVDEDLCSVVCQAHFTSTNIIALLDDFVKRQPKIDHRPNPMDQALYFTAICVVDHEATLSQGDVNVHLFRRPWQKGRPKRKNPLPTGRQWPPEEVPRKGTQRRWNRHLGLC